MNDPTLLESEYSEFVEVDPTGRYGRYNEILGKGASKTVYRAFDEYEGIEVAWNQVKLYDFLQSPEDLERLYCEIHLLKTLKHQNIMKFYTSWVDTANRNINFVTEMFTSGTLRQYRLKHKRVNIRAIKHWCRQILRGLLYLHGRQPPVIHRDLKCDNIFVNGNQGEVKIGDLGLAAILRKSHAARCVGTPEFMAPEVYEEAYNELVDIYAFGMCVLEMVTFEYPYSECTHSVQIYKKVTSGKKPEALYKVKDPEVREFVEKCLATVSLRLSARELLDDPFLQIDDCEYDLSTGGYGRELDEIGSFARQPFLEHNCSNSIYGNGYTNVDVENEWGEAENEWGYHPVEIEPNGIELFEYHDDEHSEHVDISIKGKRREDGGIFLRLRISDKEGRIRNIYFPFDIEIDTALSVATEMVSELDITDQDVTRIADMIDGEIACLVPEWRSGPGIEETTHFANQNFCCSCASKHTSSGSLMDILSNNQDIKNLLLPCCRQGCAAMHGRFEEITFQAESSEHHVTEGAPNVSSQSDCLHYYDIWGQHDSPELSSVGSGQGHPQEYDKPEQSVSAKDETEGNVNNTNNNNNPSKAGNSILNFSGSHSLLLKPSLYRYSNLSESHEKETEQELRWLKAKYHLELRELRDQQLGLTSKSLICGNGENKIDNGLLASLVSKTLQGDNNGTPMKSCAYDGHLSSNRSCPDLGTQRARSCQGTKDSPDAEDIVGAKGFYTGSLLPHSLHRTVSLPVDAIDV